MNINKIQKNVENVTEYAKESPCVRGIKCRRGTIHIRNGFDIDMCFDTIDIDGIDNTGNHIDENVFQGYFHFYDNSNGNELQIPFEDVVSVTLSSDISKNKGNLITLNYDNAEDFAIKLKHLENNSRYASSIVVKSNNFEVFDVEFSIK